MFFAQRPSMDTIDRFLRDSQELPLSYGPIGIVRQHSTNPEIHEHIAVIGHGRADFDRALAALKAWKHFQIGWAELFPNQAPVAVGTVVGVLIRHLGFWSLNGCRVVYTVGSEEDRRFGFAYGTLTNHAESGEELFEIFLQPQTDDVVYRIRATSRPQVVLARIGRPIVRLLQSRFRVKSAAAMVRAIRGNSS